MPAIKVMLTASHVRDILQILHNGDADDVLALAATATTPGSILHAIIQEYNATDDLFLTEVKSPTQ